MLFSCVHNIQGIVGYYVLLWLIMENSIASQGDLIYRESQYIKSQPPFFSKDSRSRVAVLG